MAKAKAGAKKAPTKPKISKEAKEIAASNTKEELFKIAEEEEVKVAKSAKEEVIAQALLDAGVEFTEDEGDQDTGAEDEDTGAEEAAEGDEEGDEDDEDEDEDEEEEEEEPADTIKAKGLFVAKKAGSSVKVYWPNGELCQVYTKKNVKNPGEAAKLFVDKKNNQLARGMTREGSKGKPVYPKGMTGEGTRPTHHVIE